MTLSGKDNFFEVLFAALHQEFLFRNIGGFVGLVHIGNFFAVDLYCVALQQAAGVAVGLAQFALDQQLHDPQSIAIQQISREQYGVRKTERLFSLFRKMVLSPKASYKQKMDQLMLHLLCLCNIWE